MTVEIMDMETSVDCANDHISIYDGKDSSSPLMVKLCGSMAVRQIGLHLSTLLIPSQTPERLYILKTYYTCVY